VTTARPADATAQPRDSVRPDGAQLAQGSDREPATRSVQVLASSTDRIAFGVRRSTIQHVVATSPFDDVYATPLEQPDRVTLVTVHRFGQRAPGSAVRVLPGAPPADMRVEPGERPFGAGPYPPILWNLSERVRIAFGGRVQSTPMIDAGLERPTAAVGSLTIEFGDRK
jgi:hypothetical protein